jgi:hypothetical protein
MNEKTQSDLEMNLQGIWNVISDLNTRIAKFESEYALLTISP